MFHSPQKVSLARIPVLPISWGDALPLLTALQGPVAPEAWRGVLPITYHVGPGPAKVHLKVASNWDLKPVNDVIATMRRSDAPEQWVVRGNHYDAWVNGADDPISGMVTVLASIFNEISKYGSDISRLSPFNDMTSTPPRIFKGEQFIGDLTTNTIKQQSSGSGTL